MKIFDINMETIYVPVASPKQLRDMMFKWKKNNNSIKNYSLISALVAFFCFAFFVNEDSVYGIVCSLVSGLMLLLLKIFVSKSKKFIYSFSFIGIVAFSGAMMFIEDELVRDFFMIGFFVPALVTLYFCYKAFYNYDDVYLLLSKRKGFPDFLFNTADMYADKIYLETKDKKSVAEKRVEASYNPFNEEQAITDEEVARMNSLRYEEIKTHEMDVEGGPYYEAKERKKEEVNYSKGFAIGDLNIIFPHNDIPSSPLHEKRRLKRMWDALEANTFSNEIMMLALFVSGIVVKIWLQEINSLLLFIPIVLYVIGMNLVKLRNPIGFFLMTGCGIVFISQNGITAVMCIASAVYFFVMVFPKILIWLLNYPIYKKLSKEEGFPSFEEKKDTGRIVEEIIPLEKKEKRKPIVMDVGYDEPQLYKKVKQSGDEKFSYKPKKEEAWNAFNYMNEDEQNTAYDDFAYMEQVQEQKLKAKPLEESYKPNKDMGRNRNED